MQKSNVPVSKKCWEGRFVTCPIIKNASII